MINLKKQGNANAVLVAALNQRLLIQRATEQMATTIPEMVSTTAPETHLGETTYRDNSEETLFSPVQPRGHVQRTLCERLKKMLSCMADPTDPGPAVHTNDENLVNLLEWRIPFG